MTEYSTLIDFNGRYLNPFTISLFTMRKGKYFSSRYSSRHHYWIHLYRKKYENASKFRKWFMKNPNNFDSYEWVSPIVIAWLGHDDIYSVTGFDSNLHAEEYCNTMTKMLDEALTKFAPVV